MKNWISSDGQQELKRPLTNDCYNEKGGYYVDGIGTDHGAVHSNMLPLAFNIVPESRKKSVADYIKTRGMGAVFTEHSF